MNDTPYSLLDSIQDEIATLKELEQTYKKNDKWILEAVVVGQYRSLQRIVNQYEKGHEYYMGAKDGEPRLMYRSTTRHLERDFPAVARAKQNLDTIVSLVKDENNED
jgi:hypothetical protein